MNERNSSLDIAQPEGSAGRAKPPAEPQYTLKELFDLCLQNIGRIPEDRGIESVSDWKETALVLLRHGLGPLASVVMNKDTASREIVDSLRWARTRAMLIHKTVLNLLSEMDALFQGKQIEYLVFKGPHLYEDLYRDRFPRPYSDVDILVHPKQVNLAVRVLETMGYEVEGGRITRFLMRHGHFHLVLVNRRKELPKIELHWSLVDRANLYRIRDDEVLSRAIRMTVSGMEFSIPCPEDTLIYLAVHVAKHGLLNAAGLHRGYGAEWFCGDVSENRLLWFIDIDFLIKKYAETMNWSVIAERCRNWNCLEDVITTLSVLKVLFPDSSADMALARLGGIEIPGESFLERMLFTERGMKIFERSRKMHRELVFRPARLLFGLELLFPSPVRLKSYYGLRHGWMLPLIYMWHPFHIALKQIS